MQVIFISLMLVVCVISRVFFYMEDYCTSDLCRHAFELGVGDDEVRVELLPHLIYNFSKLLFYFADLLALYPVYKFIRDPGLAFLIVVWFIQPSYDSWGLVPIIYILAYPKKYLFLTFMALLIKFKIIILAYVMYIINRISTINGRLLICRAAFIVLGVFLALVIVMLTDSQLNADETSLVGEENLFYRLFGYLVSPLSSYIAINNEFGFYENIIRGQNFFASIASLMCVVRYRLKFIFVLTAVTTAVLVDFIQIRYFLYIVTIIVFCKYVNLMKFSKTII